jgi:hypothetical protein
MLRRLADAGACTIAVATEPAGRGRRVAGGCRLRALAAAGLALEIATTVTRTNARALPDLGVLVAELTPASWRVRTGLAARLVAAPRVPACRV